MDSPETLYIIPFVKDTFWNKDYLEVLNVFKELDIPLKNVICVENTDIKNSFNNNFFKKIYELSGMTFVESDLVKDDDIYLEGFSFLGNIICKRLQEKDYTVKIIMNPPYKGSLHLEIVDQMLKSFPEAEIINISPVQWLQDILVEFKHSTEYKRFKPMLKNLSNIEVVPVGDAKKFFGVRTFGDLGIYHFTKEGGFDVDSFRLDTPGKRLAYKLATEVFPNCERFTKDIDFSKEFKFTFPANHGDRGKSTWGHLCSKDKTIAYKYIGEDIRENYIKLSFDSESERDNFYSSLFTKLIYFFVYTSKRGLRTSPNLVFIPHFLNVKWEGKSGTIDGYKYPITDEMLYEYFNLTDEEIKIIEDFASQNLK